MSLILCFLTSTLGVGQTDNEAGWLITPRPAPGQELVYRGTVREEHPDDALGEATQVYELEVRALILDAQRAGKQAAFLTLLKGTSASAGSESNAQESSARLEMAAVDAAGNLITDKAITSSIPLKSPATWENGFLLQTPAKGVTTYQSWLVEEPGRPPRRYQVIGSEQIEGTLCVKLVGDQQSEDWDTPRADSTAWRRRDALWISPRDGVAHRVERVIERRDPAHVEPTYRLTTAYRLSSSMQLSGRFLEDRRREISQALQYQKGIVSLPPGREKGAYEAIAARIDQHIRLHPVTPYRPAIVAMKRLALRAGKGERPPEYDNPPRQQFALNTPAPDFVVHDLADGQSKTLRDWRGKTVLMVFYRPESSTAARVLRHVEKLQAEYGEDELMVAGFCMSEDSKAVEKLRTRLKLTFPTLAGKSLRLSYRVEATPRFVVVDANGVVRAAHVGWGPETPWTLQADLEKCINAD